MNRERCGSVGLRDLGNGKFAVVGDLTFDTAAKFLEEGTARFASHSRIDINMADVKAADSAGLALLVEWVSWAHQLDRRISYQNLPPQILAIADISEITELLV